ncbi:hypothetical protein CR513_39745, partial [Mucuna pruriens]
MAYDQADKERKFQLQELKEHHLEAYENSQIYKNKSGISVGAAPGDSARVISSKGLYIYIPEDKKEQETSELHIIKTLESLNAFSILSNIHRIAHLKVLCIPKSD